MTSTQLLDLLTPAALVDVDRLNRNIERMAKKAKENDVFLRPHIKTHKCVEVGKMQIDHGARGITVSTLKEATSFADAGFRDITYAVPITENKIKFALDLAARVSLKVLVDNTKTVEILDSMSRDLERYIDVMVKVDCGYHRCGINPERGEAIKLVKRISKGALLNFKGILTHAGHSYLANNTHEIKRIAKQEQEVMVTLAKRLKKEGLTPEVVSIGSTPTVMLSDSFHDMITEIRPGNYVFFDYTQVVLETCKISDCSFTVLSRIVGDYSNRFVIDAGATALSKDKGPIHREPECGYGKIVRDYDNSGIEQDALIESLSQEHGKVTFSPDSRIDRNVSKMIRIIPNHSCLSANLFKHYIAIKEDSIIAIWKTISC